MKKIHVAVGVILKDKQIFLAKRHADQHQGGKWEFPGGKVESGETLDSALARELFEECGIQVLKSAPLVIIEHDYGDKQVKLDVHIVTLFSGEAHGKEDQTVAWFTLNDLENLDFPAANQGIIEQLKLHPIFNVNF